MDKATLILAPLRGVTIRAFRETFADIIREGGFTEAVTPFIPAMAGVDPLKNSELRPSCVSATICANVDFHVTPQFIGKDPDALKHCLIRIKDAGYTTADLNAGCPYPMVRNKGRGSGLLRTPDVLQRMLEVGCEVMGPNRFSVKTRLGFDRNDELLDLMPLINEFPLRFLTVHARNVRQMYDGECDNAMLETIVDVAKMPVVRNGDIQFPLPTNSSSHLMIGRAFIRSIGEREDVRMLVDRYVTASRAELCGDSPVLGRMKELIAYWKDLPAWRRAWQVIKLCRSTNELCLALPR